MPSLLDLLGETWPARMAKSAWSAAKLPGDVYAGRTDPLSEEGIGRAADLGGMVMGGTFAGAPAGAVGAGIVKPIRAYHGSPHDFERFDLSKIGTGEGAQAYGHGLYFAENPATAKSYRDALSGVNRFDSKQTGRGRMYEVNINADPAHFLDWDKALNQQGPEVTAALQQAMRPRQWQDFSPAQAGTAMKQGFIGLDEQIASEKLRDAGLPGIRYLDQGSRPLSFDPQRVADLMAAANKYRALGDTAKAAEYEKILAGYPKPTSNYVLFRDDIIDIVKKYGLAGAAAMYGISQDEAKAAMDNPKDKKMSIGRQTYGDEE